MDSKPTKSEMPQKKSFWAQCLSLKIVFSRHDINQLFPVYLL